MTARRCAYRSGYGGPRCLRAAHKGDYCKAHGRPKLTTCPSCYGEGKIWHSTTDDFGESYSDVWSPCSCRAGLIVQKLVP